MTGQRAIKVLLLPDSPKWAFENIANAIMQYNPYPDQITYTKSYILDVLLKKTKIKMEDWDYVYVMFEAESAVPVDKKREVRGCYSKAWIEPGFEKCTPEFLGGLFSQCRGVVFVNETLREYIRPFMQEDVAWTIIHDSSDETVFYPVENMKQAEFTAIFVGNHQRKVKNFPVIEKICKDLNINLILARNVPRDKLVFEYAKADICINFSDSEGGPQTFPEAALCEVPMLIRDHIALSKHIPCFKGQTPEDFIKILGHLKQNREECRAMGKEARKVVLGNFTLKSNAKKFADFFLKLATKDGIV